MSDKFKKPGNTYEKQNSIKKKKENSEHMLPIQI